MGELTYRDMVPTSKQHYLGIELEFNSPYPIDVCESLIKKYKLTKYIDIAHDSRAPDYRVNYEWKVLVNQKYLDIVIPKVINIIQMLDGETNNSCGMHVHLDMRYRQAKKCFNNLSRSQDLLFKMAIPYRRNNRYCQRIYYIDSKSNWNNWRPDHYHAINACVKISCLSKNTIEVRIKECNLNSKDIINWCKLLVAIVQAKKLEVDLLVSNVDRHLKLTPELKQYIKYKVRENL